MAALVLRQPVDQESPQRSVGGTQQYRATLCAGGDIPLSEFQLFTGDGHPPEQPTPRLGQGDPAVAALKQSAAQRLLQLPDGAGDIWLSGVQYPGCGGKAAAAGDMVKDPIVLVVDQHSSRRGMAAVFFSPLLCFFDMSMISIISFTESCDKVIIRLFVKKGGRGNNEQRSYGGQPAAGALAFCLPLFASIIFQQLYNIADSLVAGKFVGEAALAAVGNSYEITLIFIAFAFGCNIGCSVVVSQLFGAKDYRQLRTAVYTAWIAAVF